MEWVNAVDKSPCNRNVKDVELIVNRLRRVEQLSRLPNSLLHQLALCGFYEDLEKGITIYRQGDTGKCWYVILNGVLDIRVIQSDGENKIPVTICHLGTGSTFGESIIHELPRAFTVVTQTACELLRVDQCNFRLIWEKNKEFMNDLVTNSKLKNGILSQDKKSMKRVSIPKSQQSVDLPNPAKPITDNPSQLMQKAGWVLRSILLTCSNTCLKDRKLSGKLVKRCAPGTELVDWMIGRSSQIHTRGQAAGMWQALLEEGILTHVAHEQPFKDKCFLYRFYQDEEKSAPMPLNDDILAANEQLSDVINTLIIRGSDAMLRMVLRKPSHERTVDDLELIYEELLHIKALSHLSNSLKRELSSIIVFEAYSRASTILFRQGDEGKSWYIILKGSVDVVIHGKGTVTTLHEGDDFGKLALINDAPRAATIVLKENNCHFLRVEKEHFNRILRDVEANTVRLKEHDQDVLILQNISAQQKKLYASFKYKVMSGTPQKILEHLLETRLEPTNAEIGSNLRRINQDLFLDDFLLTHIIFMPTHQLVDELSRYYQLESQNEQQTEFCLTYKKRVVQFVYQWVTKIRHPVFDKPISLEFIEDLSNEIESDCLQYNILQEEANLMHNVMVQFQRYLDDKDLNEEQKWTLPSKGKPITLFSGNPECHTIIRPFDDIIFRVYCADHTYCTIRVAISSSVMEIKSIAADKLKLKSSNDDFLLVEVKSSGERHVFDDNDNGIVTTMGLNSRLFVSPKDHLDALTCLPEQEMATEGIDADLEMFSTKELAYYMTLFEWDLFWSVHEYELIYYTFGRHHFNEITANLDVFLRRFQEIQYWVVTEVCLISSMSKRISLLKKFIKLAAYCKSYQNLNAFCAIISGLSNSAISRLSSTWDKLPPKFRKMFTEFEAIIDPGRNYRAYRDAVGKLQPPVVPFMPLLINDIKFTHEGNRTCIDSLVNFEKMHLLAQTMRTIRYCRSRHLVLEPPSPKAESEIKKYISCLRAIDNQRILNNLSQKLESKKP